MRKQRLERSGGERGGIVVRGFPDRLSKSEGAKRQKERHRGSGYHGQSPTKQKPAGQAGNRHGNHQDGHAASPHQLEQGRLEIREELRKHGADGIQRQRQKQQEAKFRDTQCPL